MKLSSNKIIIIWLAIFLTMPWMCAAADPTHVATKQHSQKTVKSQIKHHKKNVSTQKQKKKPTVKPIQKKPKSKSVMTQPKTNLAIEKTPINLPHVDLSHHESGSIPTYLLTSLEKNLTNFIRATISTLNYTRYSFGGNKFDITRGIYIVDCSAYIDHILKSVSPHAYKSLKNWSGSERPTSDDYYQYFQNLTDRSVHWNAVEKVESLRPGDVIVFRYPTARNKEIAGHVMIVMEQPKREGNIFWVRIADSAPIAHSKDTRLPRTSGIGIGTMLMKIDPTTHLPYAYAWKIGSQFKNNVNIAMARPLENQK